LRVVVEVALDFRVVAVLVDLEQERGYLLPQEILGGSGIVIIKYTI
jgi:hypothetical protein